VDICRPLYIFGWYHINLYDINYGIPGINFLNHNLWEVWFEGYKQYVDPFRWVNDPYVY